MFSAVIHILNKLKKTKSLLYLPRYLPSLLSFLLAWWSRCPSGIISFQPEKLLLSLFKERICLCQILLYLVDGRMSLFHCHSLKVSSLNIEFWVESCFLSALKDIVLVSSGLHGCWGEISSCPLYVMCQFLRFKKKNLWFSEVYIFRTRIKIMPDS